MNVLVTGGAGYIGSHTVRRLLACGHKVLVVDNLSTGHRQAVPSGRLIVADLADREVIAAALAEHRIEAVMHFAASALVGESVQHPEKYYCNNFANSLNLLEAMRKAEVRRLVFSSTCATYGTPATVPITESCPQVPINPYGRSKLAVEWLLEDFAVAHGLGFAALRYFNAAGASPAGDLGEDHTPESHLIPLVLQVALGQRSAISVFGTDYPTPDGTCIRDYVHVDDLADAHVRALERIRPGQGLKLNLGTGRGHSVREVIAACEEVTGRRVQTEVAPRRAGDPPVLTADATAARAMLDWQPKYTDLREVIQTAWTWHRTHPQGFGS